MAGIDEIRAALYNASSSDQKYTSKRGPRDWGDTSVPGASLISRTRRTIVRFLEDLDSDITVAELREALGEANDEE